MRRRWKRLKRLKKLPLTLEKMMRSNGDLLIT
jgi:hypothetical protein